MEKIGFVSLGCSKNLIDTEVMLGILRDRHMEITEDLPQADIIIVNTCTFIEKAKQESIDTILQAARYKTEGKCKILIVTGCLSQQYKEDLMKEMPEIDALLGTGSWDRIWEAIDTVKKGRKACFMDDVSHLYNQNTSRLRTTPKYSAYVKIGEGCNNGCSFCIIPHVRGKLYSRPVDSVVAEVQQLAADGVKEVNLIAQDTTSYGVDLAGHSLLPELLRQLVKIDGIRWIRLHYLYPEIIDDELIDLIADEDKIVKYLDIPIQHINNDILRRMNRHCTGDEIRALLQKLRARIPGLVLRTSLITGLPGEGEAEFEELCTWLREVRLERVGVFPFSPEEGTPAAVMTDRCEPDEAQRRADLILELQAGIMDDYNAACIGRDMTVLCEHRARSGMCSGRTYADSPEIDGTVYFTGTARPGDMVTVHITGCDDGDLAGEQIHE